MNTYQLNAKRLLCPLPVIKTQNRIKQLHPGDHLEVAATDPGVKQDIPAWCRINGHRVIGIEEDNGVILVLIKVGRT